MKQKLTTEEMNWIKEELDNYTPSQFAEIFNVYRNVIAGIISNIKSGNLWTLEEEQFLIKNKDKLTYKELSEHLNKSLRTIMGKSRQLGLKKKSFSYKTQIKKGQHLSISTQFKKGNKPLITSERNKKISIAMSGENHPSFNNWSSREPYGKSFSHQLKEIIRKFYHYRCQQCFRNQNELGYKLAIHHIDYNKQNNDYSNLIPLCKSCHVQTNFKRKDWTNYFQEKVMLK